MKLRYLLFIAIGTLLLSACNMAADVTPPPNYVPPTPAPTLGPLFPTEAPNAENGKAIFAEKCAPCHGTTGLGDGEQGKNLPVSVAPLGLSEFAHDATPAKWYSVVTQGNLERFMPPFASLTDQERWDVVAYALTLHTTNDQLATGKSLFEKNCADCGNTFTSQEMMSALSEDDIVNMIKQGGNGFPAFGSSFSDDEARAVAAYIRTLSFASQTAPVAVSATETPASTEAATPSAEGTAVEGTPQAEVTAEATAETSASSQGNIHGKIENHMGGDLPSDLKITLHGYDHSGDPNAGPQETVTMEGAIHPDGTYSFDAGQLVENQLFRSEVTVDGLSYQSEYAVVPAGATDLELSTIVLYPTTEDFSTLKVEELQIYFDLASDNAQMFAVYFISNNTDKTVVVHLADGKTVPFLNLPDGGTSLGYETTNDSAKFVATGDGFAMPPSTTPYGLIAFASLPKSKSINIVQPVQLPIHAVSLFLPEGVNAEGATLTDLGVQALQNTNFHVYTAEPLNSGSSLEFTVTGEPKSTSVSPDITQNKTVIFGVGALGLALIFAGVFMYWRDRKRRAEEASDEPEDEDEFDDSESIMDAIIALDELHRSGKISDEAYKNRREELKNALKRKS